MDQAKRTIVPRSRLQLPRVAGLRRARLFSTLDGVHAARLGLVIAPPGSGKTTVMAQWAGTVPGPVAWYRADPGDRGSGLAERLGTALARAYGRGDAAVVPTAPEPDGMAALALALDDRTQPALLVVDDVHLLAGSAAEADLERLLLLAPPLLRVLLGSRRAPTFNLARTEFPAPVTLTADDLRLRSWEVEELYRDLYRTPLCPDDVAALVRHTEGWAAAVRLFHLATLGRSPAERRRAIAGLGGRCRYASGYLTAEILAPLPPSLRRFLIRTCVLEVLTGERCDALLGGHDACRALRDLASRSALVDSDDGGETFRCHRVLRHHLEAMLADDLGETGALTWYRRAADVLAGEGASAEALRASCRGQDWDGVHRLLRTAGARLARTGVPGWADLLPRSVVEDDPWVTLADARALLQDGRLERAVREGERAASAFTDPVGKELGHDIVRTARAFLPGSHPPGGHWEDALRHATRPYPAATAEMARRLDHPAGALAEGIALLVAGDHRSAEVVLRRCGDDPVADGAAAVAARLALDAVEALVEPGAETAAALDAVHLEAERRGFSWLARVAGGVVAALDGARSGSAPARTVVADCEDRGDVWGAALVATAAALAELRDGRADPRAFEELAERFRRLDAGALEAWSLALYALAAVAAGLPDADVAAATAESLARTAGIGGARAVAYAALAVTAGDDSAELLDLAASTAMTVGLGCHPWAWLGIGPDPVPTRRVSLPTQCRRPPQSPRLDITCFGSFRLTVDDGEPDLTAVRPRARAVLRLLALHAGRPVHREDLAAVLWSELDDRAAMHSIQVAVSQLRGALEPARRGRDSRVLVRDGEAYQLVLGEGSDSDLRAFDRALEEAARHRAVPAEAAVALRRAVDRYRGDVLPEDGPAEWVAEVRDQYRLRAAEAARTLADLELARGDVRAATVAARRSLYLDRCLDGAWRTLIEAYQRAGDRAAAERARRRYEAVLASLDVSGDVAAPLP
jgi:DNA-binding SARP family transcriptional activator